MQKKLYPLVHYNFTLSKIELKLTTLFNTIFLKMKENNVFTILNNREMSYL